MADLRRVELDDLSNRPGTYYNPQTEMLIIVDDSVSLEASAFDAASGADDDAEWVQISDDVPVDEAHRDELIEQFEVQDYVAGEDDEDEDDEDELEPDPDPED